MSPILLPQEISDGRLDAILEIFSLIKSEKKNKKPLQLDWTKVKKITPAGYAILACLFDTVVEQKAKITHWQFDEQLKILKELVVFVDDDEYNKNYKEALEISPDSNDVDFFALSLHENAPLWSNYGDLKKQNAIKVFSTKEMIELVG